MKLSAKVSLGLGLLTPTHPFTKHEIPWNPENYRTIMIGHVMSKIYAFALEGEVSTGAEARRLWADGQAHFRTDHSTYDHILTLRGIIEEAWYKKQRVYCYFVDFSKGI